MTVQEAPAPNGDDDSASPAVVWRNCAGTYLGVDQHDRVWGVSPSLLGWRLEVRNADEASWTYLGTHSTRDAANRQRRKPTPLRMGISVPRLKLKPSDQVPVGEWRVDG